MLLALVGILYVPHLLLRDRRRGLALLFSLALFPVGLHFVYRIAEHWWGSGTARASVLALAFFPTSFIFNAAYTESLFLALSAGSLGAARVRKDLLLDCLLAGLATATRNVGVFLLVPLALAWYADRERHGWRAAYLALAPSGLLTYAAYLWHRFGDPFLFYSAQAQWNRQPTGPQDVARVAWQNASEGLARLLGCARTSLSASSSTPSPGHRPPSAWPCSPSCSRSRGSGCSRST